MHKVVDYINSNYDVGEVYFQVLGRVMPNGKFSCPNPEHMHTNNTPSCKRYGNVFKCFGQCNRVFGPYDLLKWYDPKKIDEIKVTKVLTQEEQHKCEKITKVKPTKTDLIDVLEEITGLCL